MTLKIKKNKTKKDKFLEKHNLPKPKEEKSSVSTIIIKGYTNTKRCKI